MALRKNIFDIIESKYDIDNEFNKITNLFDSEMIATSYSQGFRGTKTIWHTLEEITQNVFCEWESRGTCLSCQDMKKELGITDILQKETTSIEEKILCLEYYTNIEHLFASKIFYKDAAAPYQYTKKPIYKMFFENFQILLDHLNYEEFIFPKERVVLIPKNLASTAVAEISPNHIAMAILKYNHFSLKGNLSEKRELLLSIANEYESLLKKPIEGYTEFFSKTTGLLNNLNVRHDNTKGKNKNPIAEKMNPEEQEKWYDEIYQMLLFCVLIKDNIGRKKEADELLKKIRNKG
ncbi:MAG: hypothetical protein PHI50_00185 [Alphaproteobacteria bacterium]|nr:hypothetical protein [Alphaproteobacteria bacterium]